jgi:hypothetical protein
MNTWPISRTTKGGWTYLGIPDRLGSGGLWQPGDSFPTLEEVAGEGWSSSILSALLPAERAWAWWTRNDAYRSTKLPTTSAGDDIDLGELEQVVVRRMRLSGMSLAFVPARDLASQQIVTHWAGNDVEQIPDHIWTAPNAAQWSSDEIVAWCRDADQWSDRTTIPRQPAERIVTLFDNQVFCAVREEQAPQISSRIAGLASTWNVSIIDGPLEYTWPVLSK